MKITLNLTAVPGDAVVEPDFDDELDDASSLIASICEQIDESGKGQFTLSAFGDGNWPVDIPVDLVVMLEQLPEVIGGIRSRVGHVSLDFYEQGIQRFLHFNFEERDDTYKISCESWTKWEPDESKPILTADEAVEMLGAVRDEFVRFVNRTAIGDRFRSLVIAWMRDERLSEE